MFPAAIEFQRVRRIKQRQRADCRGDTKSNWKTVRDTKRNAPRGYGRGKLKTRL
jgi:hypothetical protein